MQGESATTSMTVRQLREILDQCDDDALVRLAFPLWAGASDSEVLDEQDGELGEVLVTPDVRVGFVTDNENYGSFFDENHRWRPGVKANSVTIALGEHEAASQLRVRKRAIDRAARADVEFVDVTQDGVDAVVDVRISREDHTHIRRLLRAVNASKQVAIDHGCTHGMLTVGRALEMFAEDLAMVEARPGSWEASNMAAVLCSHGYVVG